MDAAIYWIIGLGVSAFAGVFIWLIREGKREATRRLENDLARLGASKEQLEQINDAQATPFHNAAAANDWVRQYRGKHD